MFSGRAEIFRPYHWVKRIGCRDIAPARGKLYHRSMRLMLKLLLVAAISAAVSTIVLPVQAKMLPLSKAACCEHMSAPSNGDGCGGHPAKPSPDRQCCAACALGLTIFPGTFMPLIYSPGEGEMIFSDFLSTSDRSDQPPVPPPRAQLV